MTTPHRLIEEARALKGIPWRHLGRSKSGLDCIGFVILAMTNSGVDLFAEVGLTDRRKYGRKATAELLILIERHLTPAPHQTPGALTLFRFPAEAHPRHLGICTFDGYVIHCNAVHGGVMEHGLRAQWAKWLHSVWLLPGISYE